MARGWESKAVEAQQEESAGKGQGARQGGPPTPEEVAAHQERQALELARARARADLETATRPARRQMLQRALAAIETRLAGLGGGRGAPRA
jgi:hypothetical protein